MEELKKLGIGHLSGEREHELNEPTILMVHGAGGRAQIWQNQIPELGKKFHAVAIDLPGHGITPDAGITSISGYAKWIVNLVDSIFHGGVILMGHSMGGAIIMNTSIIKPDHIRALILVSTGLKLKVAPQFLEGLKSNSASTVDAIIKYAYHPETSPSVILEGARWMKDTPEEILYNDFNACNEFDMSEDAKGIDLPTLIICGEQDMLTPPKLSNKIKDTINNSTLKLVPSSGHMVMIEKPVEFNRIVLEYITSILK
jgi:pimeloyl-ACP methyl ester carboxylesterase